LRYPFVSPVLLFAPTTEKLDPPQRRGTRSYVALCAASSKAQTPLSEPRTSADIYGPRTEAFVSE
jgi:hypothetical protein